LLGIFWLVLTAAATATGRLRLTRGLVGNRSNRQKNYFSRL
jgi:hypothetical protein